MSFEAPQSRNEAILQNILGADNAIGTPKSRIEAILQAILNNSAEIPAPYSAPPQSRNEELLVEIWRNGGSGGGGIISIDPDSQKPIVLGMDSTSWYASNNPSDEVKLLIGRDADGEYYIKSQEV